MEPDAALTVRGLHACYGHIEAIKGIDVLVRQGEFIAILGPNGAGKSTLMKSIVGVVTAQSGSIVLYGHELCDVSPAVRIRLGLGIIPEGRQLFADMTVRENLILGAYAQLKISIHRRIEGVLARVFELFPRLRERQDQLAGTLSGGEAQMLAIGRALMTTPRILLCDEPSIGLAPMFVREVLLTLSRLHQQGTTIILADQNALAALRIAQRAYVLDSGCVVAEGTPQELLGNPRLRSAYLGVGLGD